MNGIYKRRKKQKELENIEVLQVWICCSFDVSLGRTTTVMKHMALKRTLGRRGPWRLFTGNDSPSDWDTKSWRTEAEHFKDFCTFLTKGGREGVNNVIKRRQDWQKRNCCREKRNEREVNGVGVRARGERDIFLLSVTLFVFFFCLELVLDLIFSWMNRPQI